MTAQITLLAPVEICANLPPFASLFKILSYSTPKGSFKPSRINSLNIIAFSPIPAVNAIKSTPPNLT